MREALQQVNLPVRGEGDGERRHGNGYDPSQKVYETDPMVCPSLLRVPNVVVRLAKGRGPFGAIAWIMAQQKIQIVPVPFSRKSK
jgi:hypothetical protein